MDTETSVTQNGHAVQPSSHSELAEKPQSLEQQLTEQLRILKLKIQEVCLQIQATKHDLAKGEIPQSLEISLNQLGTDFFQFIDSVSDNNIIKQQVRNRYKTDFLDKPLQEYFMLQSTEEDEQKSIHELVEKYVQGPTTASGSAIEDSEESTAEELLLFKLDNKTLDSIIITRDSLLAQEDIHMIRRLLLHVAYTEMNKMFEDILHLPSRPISPARLTKLRASIYHGSPVRPEGNEIDDIKSTDLADPSFIRCWQTTKESPVLAKVFGDHIQTIDTRFYNDILDKSLFEEDIYEPNEYAIESLVYYPTPAAIRNLLILASTDNRGQRLKCANKALSTLARRSDWNRLLEEFQDVYPEAAGVNSFLRSYKHYHDYAHPDMSRATANYMRFLVEHEQNEGARSAAVDALSTQDLTEMLMQRTIITPEEQNDLASFNQILKDTPFIAGGPQVEHNTLHRAIREHGARLLDKHISPIILQQHTDDLRRLSRIAKEIITQKENLRVVSFLSQSSLIDTVTKQELSLEDSIHCVQSYKDVPFLLHHADFIRYLPHFLEPGRFEVYESLASRAPLLLESSSVFIRKHFLDFGKEFIHDSEDFDYITKFIQGSIDSQDASSDQQYGKTECNLEQSNKIDQDELSVLVTGQALYGYSHMEELLNTGVTPKTWYPLLVCYLDLEQTEHVIERIPAEQQDQLRDLFKLQQTKNICLEGIHSLWKASLNNPDCESFSFLLHAFSSFIHEHGAGPLKHIEAIAELTFHKNQQISDILVDRTINSELHTQLSDVENRFEKENWSQEDRTHFYTTVTNIIREDPELLMLILDSTKLQNKQEFSLFVHELVPLYNVSLALMSRQATKKKNAVNSAELVGLKNQIVSFSQEFTSQHPEAKLVHMQLEKQQLYTSIREQFKNKFGIIKIPEEFSEENFRSIRNIGIFLSNIHDRDTHKELVLALYLGLSVNGKWNGFREGKSIPVEEFFDESHRSFYHDLLQQRASANPLTAEALGIDHNDLPQVQAILQHEDRHLKIGSVQTIDVKLASVIQNIHELGDEDLYPDEQNRTLFGLIHEYNGSVVNATIAKTYQQLQGKTVTLKSEEMAIQSRLQKLTTVQGLPWEIQTIKDIQQKVAPITLTRSLEDFAHSSSAQAEIDTLRQLLEPSEQVCAIFQRLGEDFKPTSGAMALSQDLSDLENLMVKKADQLESNETALLTTYLNTIHGQMKKLENILSTIRQKFDTLKKNSLIQNNPVLAARISDIDDMVNAKDNATVITTEATHNINEIIENIRACLGCMRREVNNDTTLSFGDPTKFLLLSKAESQKGSIADQIVFIDPITYNGTQEVSFVFDRLYGTKSKDIALSHIETILLKYHKLKAQFPDIKLSLCLTSDFLGSIGITDNILIEQLQQSVGTPITAESHKVEVNIAPSVLSDHYIEFGTGEPRAAGVRSTQGIIIK